ncbi:acetolactate synthase [Pseudonocardia sp. EC080610-09]|uniref:thiamine pyrophosphate-binding protein n=1 Tax=unclassified Pseudonocardia TaxID=2619320 RepID=UPI0006CB5A20|nr:MULTISPECIES: thiamine pyrophosphate-binding protein [unclassified Pseudonocardia]ALE72461.1 acetolactate synthase [Pseudonocardia sp. EC080625-04]ALL75768.1 acetolactate synthase [Pseudonocardia sp. EC080610-09]ALL82795.1 acetolactate synthase [Pseudonocardia sp. EC080619-01]
MTEEDPSTVAALVARFLYDRGVRRVFGLQGGHIQPIWDRLARLGVAIVDVRDEAAAVHMAHAHSELTGEMGIALATAGPGVTNTVTAVANASVSRIPLLLLGGCPPRPQANKHPLQDIPHTEILRPVTRQSRTLRVGDEVLRELDEGWSRATGDAAEPGPVYLEIPTDVLRETVPPAVVLDEHLRAPRRRRSLPHPDDVAAVAELLRGAEKPAVITGRGARTAPEELVRFLDATGAAYLDTQEGRGLVPPGHPAVVGALRSRVMREADLVVTVGRQLDYQLGFGSPAAFPDARWVRVSDSAGELHDNRRGEVEILADVGSTLDALAAAAGPDPDTTWRDGLRKAHLERFDGYRDALAATPPGGDGRMHPNHIFAALNDLDLDGATVVADGGDLLSFARLGVPSVARYLDAGAFGCLGVGVPFAIAAALANPDRPAIAVTGDGAFGINAMEVNTAVRHGVPIVVIVSNNAAWNIERYDQAENYGLVVGTELDGNDYAALGRALGAHGERVTEPGEMAGALERALANAPAVIDVVTSRDAPSPDAGKGLGWVPDYQALTPWNDAEVKRREP